MSYFNKNTIITIGVFAVGIIGLAFLLPKRDTTGGNTAITDGNNEQNSDDNHNNVFAVSDVANQLYILMSSFGFGRSADVLSVFVDRVPRTNSAFEKLKTAFGLRQHNGYTGGTSFGSNKNLIEWLKAEMKSEHYQTLKSFYPNQPWI